MRWFDVVNVHRFCQHSSDSSRCWVTVANFNCICPKHLNFRHPTRNSKMSTSYEAIPFFDIQKEFSSEKAVAWFFIACAITLCSAFANSAWKSCHTQSKRGEPWLRTNLLKYAAFLLQVVSIGNWILSECSWILRPRISYYWSAKVFFGVLYLWGSFWVFLSKLGLASSCCKIFLQSSSEVCFCKRIRAVRCELLKSVTVAKNQIQFRLEWRSHIFHSQEVL